jgi:hypothetical protein
MTSRPRPRRRRPREEADEIRERRLAECRTTVEDFLFELGRLMAGHEPHLEQCASRSLVYRLRTALEPFLGSGGAVRPDFGTHGELRVDGDLLDAGTPLQAWVEFDDRSMLVSGDRLLPVPRRRIRMEMVLSVQPCRVTDIAVACGSTA